MAPRGRKKQVDASLAYMGFEKILQGDFFTGLVEKSKSVFWIRSGTQIYVSPAYETIWGRSCESLRECPNEWNDSIHPDDRTALSTVIAMSCADMSNFVAYDERYRIVRPDGEVRWIKDVGFPLYDVKGDFIGVAGIAEDITQETVYKRTLVEAKEKAEAANLVKSEFLAMVSHELRTPLNGILGMTQILAKKNPREDQKAYIDDLYDSVNVLLALISDLLDVTKLEAGKFEFVAKPFDLRRLVQDTVASLSILAKEKNLELVIDYKDDVPTSVLADARRIRQIITNLLGNAIKFTETGYIIIAVDSVEEEESRAVLKLSVKDTGVGIPPDKLEFIFERFNQLEPSYRSKTNSGTGLGLSIVRQMVEGLGGTVEVTSQVGKGSEFVCHIPFPLQPRALASQQSWANEHADMRILVVDDNPETGRIICKQLNTPDSQSTTSEMALEALVDAYEQGKPYHVVVIDDRITFMDAIAFGKTIHLQPKFEDPILLLLSRPSPFSKKEKARLAGYYDSLIKPIEPTKLLSVLADAWKARIEEKRRKAQVSKQQKKILLVEDNPLNQKIARIMLEELGYHVFVADSGFSAMGLLSHGYDLILMDINLGDMDGYTLTDELRRREKQGNKRTPVIAMTANAFDSDRQKCLDAGMDGVLTKPVDYNELRTMLDGWINVKNQTEEINEADLECVE